MTRKEELSKRAKETTEQLLAEGVCLSDGECGITDRVILQALKKVEREVLRRCQDKIESLMEKENESTDDQVWEYRDWLKEQQKELG